MGAHTVPTILQQCHQQTRNSPTRPLLLNVPHMPNNKYIILQLMRTSLSQNHTSLLQRHRAIQCNSENTQMIGWELWEHTQGSGTGGTPGLFIPSPYWSTNNANAQSGYCGEYLVYGPFRASHILTYSRYAPAHDYIIIKFFFVRINWGVTDVVNFTYSSTSTNTTYLLPLQYIGNGSTSSGSNYNLI